MGEGVRVGEGGSGNPTLVFLDLEYLRAWFLAQYAVLGSVAENNCFELLGDDFDLVAESASEYSRADLRRAHRLLN